jgi:uncharacterized lipoprotein YehR (DUF1307 family)
VLFALIIVLTLAACGNTTNTKPGIVNDLRNERSARKEESKVRHADKA